MARGRMLNNTIATDDRLNALSPNAQRLWFFALPHIDRDGLLDGRPAVLWARAAPLQFDLMDIAGQIINEWLAAGLVVRYNGDRTPVLFFPAFQRNQSGMRYDREPLSQFAPPPGYYRSELGLQPIDEPMTDNAGSLPADFRQTSGKCPPEREIEVEIEDQGKGEGEAAPPPAPVCTPAPSVEVALDGGTITAKSDATTVKALTQQPQIVTYRAIFQTTPSRALMLQILEHEINDISRWEAVMIAWLRKGYNPLNIGGMFDWYDHPELMSSGPRSAAPAGAGRGVAKTTLNMQTIDAYFDRKENGGQPWTPQEPS